MNILVKSVNTAASSIDKAKYWLEDTGRRLDNIEKNIKEAEELMNRLGKCINVSYMCILSLKAVMKK